VRRLLSVRAAALTFRHAALRAGFPARFAASRMRLVSAMPARAADGIEFDVWGCRGSHNIVPANSKVGNCTSCYSILSGEELFIFDAGRGLLILGHSMDAAERFKQVKRVHVLVTHAHLDHWEGLKDVDWFWRPNNGLHVTIYGTREALGAIERGFAHPSYVPLEVLARHTVASLRKRMLRAKETHKIGGFTLQTFPLHHYSGGPRSRRFLDTLGYRLAAGSGPCIAYLSDHEPTPKTRTVEDAMVSGAHLAIFDSHFKDVTDQKFGHGSQEHAARVARVHPSTIVLAGHIGPMFSDDEVFATHRRHSDGLPNFRLAVEGMRYRWNSGTRAFEQLAHA
jgi:phosphoribosyl 1,2-cyclic phosphodiesterase